MSKTRKSAYGLVTVAILCVLLEVGSRLILGLLGPAEVPLRAGRQIGQEGANVAIGAVLLADERLFFRLRPNLDMERTRSTRIFGLKTNSLGLRGGPVTIDKAAGTFRVLCVGDSCTFGSGAATNRTYPAQLQARLREMRPGVRVEVINAGVPGYSSFQGRRYLESEGIRLSPDCVVIALGYNDAIPAQTGPGRPFRAGSRFSDREYGEALARSSRLGVARLANRVAASFRRSAAPETFPAPGLKTRVSLDESRENLARMISFCSQRGIAVVVLAWPVAPQSLPQNADPVTEIFVGYQRAARAVADEAGVAFVDLVATVAGRPALFIDHVHMTPKGYGLVAERIAERIVPLLPPAEGS